MTRTSLPELRWNRAGRTSSPGSGRWYPQDAPAGNPDETLGAAGAGSRAGLHLTGPRTPVLRHARHGFPVAALSGGSRAVTQARATACVVLAVTAVPGVTASVMAGMLAVCGGARQTELGRRVVRRRRRPARSLTGSPVGRLGIPARAGPLKPVRDGAQPGSWS